MDILGVIPVRWQSSRFPGKPLANILGKSLIRRTYENAAQCSRLQDLIIATDDSRIFEHVKEFGAKVVMTSTKCCTGTDRVNEAVKNYGCDPCIVVNIQGDEPCLDPKVIDRLVEKLESSSGAVLTTPVALIENETDIASPSVVKCIFDSQGKALYFSRSPIPYYQTGKSKNLRKCPYYRHLGIYCFKRRFLDCYTQLEKTPLQEAEDLEQLKILEHGFPIHVCIVEDQTIGVDTLEDLKKIESYLCQKENISSLPEALSPR